MQTEKPKKLRMRSGNFIALTALPMAILLLLSVALTVVSNMLASTLDTYLGKGTTQKIVPDGTAEWDTEYYTELYSNTDDSAAAAYAVAEQVMEEGSVLLKNNGILPLAKGSTLTPFGRGYLDPIYGQLTSGGSAKWVVDPVTPAQALGSVYTLNNTAVDKMKAAGSPEALGEAEGTSKAGEAGSMLGGDSFLYEYDPAIYEGMDDVSGTTGIVFLTRAG